MNRYFPLSTTREMWHNEGNHVNTMCKCNMCWNRNAPVENTVLWRWWLKQWWWYPYFPSNKENEEEQRTTVAVIMTTTANTLPNKTSFFLWEEAAVGLVDELLIVASQEYVNATSCSKPLRSKLRELQEPYLSSSPITWWCRWGFFS